MTGTFSLWSGTTFRLNPQRYCNKFTFADQFHKLNSMALVRTRTIPTERPPPVGEVSANFCG